MIVVAGEALIDLMAYGTGALHRAVPGGSPANVAVTVARLGQPVRLMARLSDDTYGRQIRLHLLANDVDLTWAVDATQATSLAIASLDEAGSATYEFRMYGTADWQWTPAELPPPLASPAVALHSGSLALAQQPGAGILEGLLARERYREAITVSIDLNLRPSIIDDVAAEHVRITRQVRLAHIVKASDEDLAWLYPGVPITSILSDWQAAGVTCGVVTQGGDGVLFLAPDGTVHQRPAVPVRVRDTVGAGDAFTGGMLAALAEIEALGDQPASRLAKVTTDEWHHVLDYAARVAAITCTRQGADPPTLTDVA